MPRIDAASASDAGEVGSGDGAPPRADAGAPPVDAGTPPPVDAGEPPPVDAGRPPSPDGGAPDAADAGVPPSVTKLDVDAPDADGAVALELAVSGGRGGTAGGVGGSRARGRRVRAGDARRAEREPVDWQADRDLAAARRHRLSTGPDGDAEISVSDAMGAGPAATFPVPPFANRHGAARHVDHYLANYGSWTRGGSHDRPALPAGDRAPGTRPAHARHGGGPAGRAGPERSARRRAGALLRLGRRGPAHERSQRRSDPRRPALPRRRHRTAHRSARLDGRRHVAGRHRSQGRAVDGRHRLRVVLPRRQRRARQRQPRRRRLPRSQPDLRRPVRERRRSELVRRHRRHDRRRRRPARGPARAPDAQLRARAGLRRRLPRHHRHGGAELVHQREQRQPERVRVDRARVRLVHPPPAPGLSGPRGAAEPRAVLLRPAPHPVPVQRARRRSTSCCSRASA